MLSVALVVFFGWIASVCLHEFGHAIVAYWGGDKSVKDKGYLTLNPLKYTDVSYSLVLPLIFLLMGGIPLPGAAVYIDRSRLRGPLWQSAVSLAGPAMSAVVAIALALPFLLGQVPPLTENWGWSALAFLATLQIAGVILNLLPIPSLDGFGAIEPWLPVSLRRKTYQWSRYGILVLFVLLWWVPGANRLFWAGVDAIAQLLQIPADLTAQGYNRFTVWAPYILVGLIVLVILWQQLMPRLLDWLQGQKWFPYSQGVAIAAYRHALSEGDRLFQQQQYPEASTAYQRAADLNPNRYEPWYGKATVLLMLQHNEPALAAYDKVLVLQPDFHAAWHGRGLALQRLGELERALVAYERGLLLKPDDLPLLIDRGTVLHNLQRYDEAIASYTQAIALQPDLGVAYYNRACCETLQGQQAAAIADLRQAIRLEPGFRAIARTDADWNALRDRPEFTELVG